MAWEVVVSEWEHVAPGHFLRADGAEVVKTGARTWTLEWALHGEVSNHRTAKAAMARADQL